MKKLMIIFVALCSLTCMGANYPNGRPVTQGSKLRVRLNPAQPSSDIKTLTYLGDVAGIPYVRKDNMLWPVKLTGDRTMLADGSVTLGTADAFNGLYKLSTGTNLYEDSRICSIYVNDAPKLVVTNKCGDGNTAYYHIDYSIGKSGYPKTQGHATSGGTFEGDVHWLTSYVPIVDCSSTGLTKKNSTIFIGTYVDHTFTAKRMTSSGRVGKYFFTMKFDESKNIFVITSQTNDKSTSTDPDAAYSPTGCIDVWRGGGLSLFLQYTMVENRDHDQYGSYEAFGGQVDFHVYDLIMDEDGFLTIDSEHEHTPKRLYMGVKRINLADGWVKCFAETLTNMQPSVVVWRSDIIRGYVTPGLAVWPLAIQGHAAGQFVDEVSPWEIEKRTSSGKAADVIPYLVDRGLVIKDVILGSPYYYDSSPKKSNASAAPDVVFASNKSVVDASTETRGVTKGLEVGISHEKGSQLGAFASFEKSRATGETYSTWVEDELPVKFAQDGLDQGVVHYFTMSPTLGTMSTLVGYENLSPSFIFYKDRSQWRYLAMSVFEAKPDSSIVMNTPTAQWFRLQEPGKTNMAQFPGFSKVTDAVLSKGLMAKPLPNLYRENTDLGTVLADVYKYQSESGLDKAVSIMKDIAKGKCNTYGFYSYLTTSAQTSYKYGIGYVTNTAQRLQWGTSFAAQTTVSENWAKGFCWKVALEVPRTSTSGYVGGTVTYSGNMEYSNVNANEDSVSIDFQGGSTEEAVKCIYFLCYVRIAELKVLFDGVKPGFISDYMWDNDINHLLLFPYIDKMDNAMVGMNKN